MLSKEDNEKMCRTGPGTPMGEAMRRYWIPLMESVRVPQPGGDPVGIEVMSEKFVVWRDKQGRPGLYAEKCPHRGASMLLACAEDDGLRCIYHGWKFAVDGTVLEVPNVAEPRFKQRIRGRTYPVREAGGLLWGYIGPKEHEPPFPKWPFLDLPKSNILAALSVTNCNYVQVIEGLVDSSHLTVLHSSALKANSKTEMDFAKKTAHMQFDASPFIEAEETDFGFHYVAIRGSGEKRMARVASFIAPFSVLNPNGDIWLAAVPINDEQCNFFHVYFDPEKKIGEEPLRSQQLALVGLDEPSLARYGMTPETCNGPNVMTFENGYLQDREQQRQGHFTGYVSFNQEDAACAVSSGGIRDRSQELLCSADGAISRLYRVLLACANAVSTGDEMPGSGDIGSVIGVSKEIGANDDWRIMVPDHKVVSR